MDILKKLTREEWDKLTREEKREALIRFEAPDKLYQAEKWEEKIIRQEKI